eukprot:TRINITY_DN245_c0_g1_i2.p3 TRINITY_DN245_c0_g1~~TRINITY_DN245_c0_g1_i2.p3  ORF type:complete len:172 (+),score=30.28 TRINITY_DN245_c0_g1_i2:78-593(+)
MISWCTTAPPSPPPPCQDIAVKRCRLANCTVIEYRGSQQIGARSVFPLEIAKVVLFDLQDVYSHCYSACMGLGCMGWQGLSMLGQGRGGGEGEDRDGVQQPSHPMCEDVGQVIWSMQPCCQEYRAKVGEKLCEVAAKFNINCEALGVLNDLDIEGKIEEYVLYSGYVLQIC